MIERPGIIGKLVAIAKGEVPADTLEAFERGGQAVYELLTQAEDRRLDLKIQGLTPWTVDTATQTLFLSSWNAFVLQTLADQLLQADYQADPMTVGYVPPITAAQCQAYYSQVQIWLSRAQQARNNPTYQLDIDLPAYLPSWDEQETCPNSHLDGMVAATRLLQTHAEVAIAAFEAEAIPTDKHSALQQIHQRLAAANSAADYAQQLWKPNVPQEVHPQIEQFAKAALEQYYYLGQILAMPQLLSSNNPFAETRAARTQASSLPLPGHGDFDPWCLTDTAIRDDFQRDPRARAAIADLWKNDPDPDKTLAIQTEINTALLNGDIGYPMTRSGQRIGHYYCCPWASIYVVRRPVVIADQHLRPRQQFTFAVSAMDIPQGGSFQRKILVGTFQSTDETCLSRPAEHQHRLHQGC